MRYIYSFNEHIIYDNVIKFKIVVEKVSEKLTIMNIFCYELIGVDS